MKRQLTKVFSCCFSARLFSAVSLAAVLLAGGLAAGAAFAEGWRLSVPESPFGPPQFLIIDKDSQNLFFMSHQSPVRVDREYVCSTGQAVGDKFQEGDLRTPEGVYFVENRLDAGLNYDLYGSLAFTLNFPNPVDRLKGKTGSGIWLHGRGHAVTDRETKGCVALNNQDILGLDGKVEPGMPVLIARSVSQKPYAGPQDVLRQLVANVESWALAWRAKSDMFFEYYHPERFSKTSGSFDYFKDHKVGLFERLPWIQVTVHDMKVLPGPDYWVTWFHQYYRTEELETEGVKRLYWQQDEQGRLRIVGKEWRRKDLGLRTQYLAQMTRELTDTVEAWRSRWQAADLDGYMSFYASGAVQDKREGAEAIRIQKGELWDRARPVDIDVSNVQVDMHPQGLQVTFVQRYEAANNYSDVGYKTMIMQPVGGSWRIVSETWEEI